MKVTCVYPFFDAQERVDREVGDSWECSEERFSEMNATVFGKLVEEVAEAPKPRATKTRKQKATEE